MREHHSLPSSGCDVIGRKVGNMACSNKHWSTLLGEKVMA